MRNKAAAGNKKETAKKRGGKIVFCLLFVLFALILTNAVVSALWKSDPGNVEPYTGNNPYIASGGRTFISAHRSGGGIAPEESMMAFRNCVENGGFTVDDIEFDLHITKDGELVLLHDDTLDRTTDSRKVFGEKNARPEDYTYAELRQLNIGANFVTDSGETPFKGLSGDDVPDDLRIVRLVDLLDYLEENGDFGYFIETKNGGELGKKAVDALYRILDERGLLSKVIWGTFHGEITEYADENYPDLPRSARITEVLDFYFSALFDKKNFEPEYVSLSMPFNMPYRLIANLATARMINYAHEHDIAAQYWTINGRKDMEYLTLIGADCIMTDYPDILYGVVFPDIPGAAE